MKKILFVLLVCSTLKISGAYTYNTHWNICAPVGMVRQNGDGFWFILNGDTQFLGVWNSFSNYTTLVSTVLTAKAVGLPVCVNLADTVIHDTLPGSGGVLQLNGVTIQ